MKDPERERVGLPPRIFYYTIDQLATILEIREAQVKKLLYYEGRQVGFPKPDQMRAVNIMPEGETPEWRVSEQALLKYLRYRGIKYYTRGYVF